MKSLKPAFLKKSAKYDRERKVLIGLVEYFLKTGKPVGSNTLKETGFGDLSSATIRNYFAHLEKEGYLTQQHSSGGRIPTNLAYRLYAQEFLNANVITEDEEKHIHSLRNNETREIAAFLPKAAELLSSLTNCAVFLSAPRFDQDFISNLKLVPIDHSRCLCVIITDFGMIQTEMLASELRLSTLAAKRIEAYFQWRLTGHNKPENLSVEEEKTAQSFYNELMVRYIVGYSNFTDESLFRTGFSKLLNYQEFLDPATLAHSLALFENTHSMRMLLRECGSHDTLKFWIGDDLSHYTMTTPDCAVLAVPYHINKNSAGAFGLLGPTRMPYRQLFGILRAFADSVSEALTRNIFKFKISFRKPKDAKLISPLKEEYRLIGQSRLMLLLENKGVK